MRSVLRSVTLVVGLLSWVLLASCGVPREEGTRPPADSGATAAAAGAIEDPLADTEWRLVEIQSMDDAAGTARPDDRSKYTMRLNRDGTVVMRLNCNNANGTWKAQPASDRISGSLELGLLATTRALCPPPSLDERISSQAQYVRGYLLKDGRLNLSLMADGGIYVWEPADIEVPFLTTPDTALEAAILSAAPSYTMEVVDARGESGRARYIYGRVDLNGDGTPEVFAYLLGSIFCGTGGCDLMLFTEANGAYALVNNFPISRPPVIVSPTRTGGWNDLVRVESGGGAEPTYLRHTFDGQRYVEAERTPIGPAPPEGKRLLAGELTFAVGIPLVPRN